MIGLGKQWRLYNRTHYLIYLLRIEVETKSHYNYIYIKRMEHWFNLHRFSCHLVKRFWPVAAKRWNARLTIPTYRKVHEFAHKVHLDHST